MRPKSVPLEEDFLGPGGGALSLKKGAPGFLKSPLEVSPRTFVGK